MGAEFGEGGLVGDNIGVGGLVGADIGEGGLSGADIGEGGLTGADIGEGGLNGAAIGDGGIIGAEEGKETGPPPVIEISAQFQNCSGYPFPSGGIFVHSLSPSCIFPQSEGNE